jgi:hypothetical protein
MRRKIFAVFAAFAAAAFILGAAGSAQAAPVHRDRDGHVIAHFDHPLAYHPGMTVEPYTELEFSDGCHTGPSGVFGTDVFLKVDVHQSGSTWIFDSMGWNTSPHADLDRIAISWRSPIDGTIFVMGAAGGTSGTQNDVANESSGWPSANYVPSDWPKGTASVSGFPGDWRGSVWGGQGDSNASCNTGFDSM